MSEFVLLVSDPNGPRRQAITQQCANSPYVQMRGATTLGETYRLAESLLPVRVAVAAEIANSREFETLSEMIAMIGADLILYGESRKNKSAHKFIALQGKSNVDQLVTALLSGLSPPRKIPLRPAKPAMIHQTATSAKTSRVILVGASTGGIPALETVLKEFPADCPPTLVVQHIRSGFAGGLVRRLNQILAPKVVAAEDGMILQNGVIYFAVDPTKHLGITLREVLRTRLVSGPTVCGHCPSVNMLFQQAAAIASQVDLRAAILTGMGFDGAEGMLQLRQAGAFTIAQDRETSVVWGMPRVAIEKDAVCEVLPVSRIGSALLRPEIAVSPKIAKHKT